jgi:hypothetical protein
MEEKPIFDFSKVSRVWAREWRSLVARAMKANTILASVPMPGLTGNEMVQVQLAKAEAMEDINTIEAERDRLVVQVLKSVPRGWLVDDAPQVIDWASVDSLDYLLESRYAELFDVMNEARQEPKN